MNRDEQDPPEHTHAGRYRQIGAALRRHGLGFVLGLFGLDRMVPGGAAADALKRVSAESPAHLRAALEELGPTFIKLGQLLSTRSDLLPPAFIAELAKLQDAAPPVPVDVIRDVIRSELGAAPEEIFASFDDRPLASASIGQAHAATLDDGTPVVVKVRRPDAVALVQTDLEILQNLATRATRAWELARDVDAIGIVDEFVETIRAELDYLQEGRNAERFARNFEDDTSVVVPRVYWEQTTSRVLTLQRMGGINVADAEALDAEVDRELVARRGADIVLKMIFEDRFFHADLHPGNLFIHDDGTIALIDFGMVGVIGEELRGHLSRLFIAMVRGDAELLTAALIDVSVTGASADRMTLRDDLRPFVSRYQLRSVRQTPFARMTADLFAILRSNRVRLPHEMMLLFKALLLIEALAMRLDPDFRLGEALEPYAERLAWERLRASALAKRLARASIDAGALALDLPSIVRRLVDAADTTGIQVHLRAAELEPLVGRAERIGNRLVAGMIGAALISGIGGLVSADRRWGSWRGTMVGTGLGAIGALGAYLTWTARHRRLRCRRARRRWGRSGQAFGCDGTFDPLAHSEFRHRENRIGTVRPTAPNPIRSKETVTRCPRTGAVGLSPSGFDHRKSPRLMRILVFGAGVLGSLYAARLHGAGQDVTLYARGDRLTALLANGVQLQEARSGVKETAWVPVTGVIGAGTAYDLVLVFVRGDQLAAAARSLAEHRASGSILFMVNNPAGCGALARTVGAERLMLGFAGRADTGRGTS